MSDNGREPQCMCGGGGEGEGGGGVRAGARE
jgi:hypothetical protein